MSLWQAHSYELKKGARKGWRAVVQQTREDGQPWKWEWEAQKGTILFAGTAQTPERARFYAVRAIDRHLERGRK